MGSQKAWGVDGLMDILNLTSRMINHWISDSHPGYKYARLVLLGCWKRAVIWYQLRGLTWNLTKRVPFQNSTRSGCGWFEQYSWPLRSEVLRKYFRDLEDQIHPRVIIKKNQDHSEDSRKTWVGECGLIGYNVLQVRECPPDRWVFPKYGEEYTLASQYPCDCSEVKCGEFSKFHWQENTSDSLPVKAQKGPLKLRCQLQLLQIYDQS